MSIFKCPKHGLHHGPVCPFPCDGGSELVTFEPVEQVIERDADRRIIKTHLGDDLLGPLAGNY